MVPHFRNPVPQALIDSALPEIVALTESHRVPSSASEIPRPTGGDEPERSSSRASSILHLLNPPSSIESHTTASSEPLLAGNDGLEDCQSPTSISGQATSDAEVQTRDEIDVATFPRDAKSSPGGVKRSHDEMVEKETSAKEVTSAQVPSLPSYGSHVRLSMSLDGAVKVKTNDAETPSPPKQRAPAPMTPRKSAGGLQRSKSAIILGDQVCEGRAGKMKSKAVGGQFGRSRDARTWEFYCDNDVREALSAHAENERTGSAVGAISLIRSQSQKTRFQMVTERSGASNARNPTAAQPGVKPKLSRSKSSMGRLQDTENAVVKPPMKEGKASRWTSPSGDSDKENWAPGTRSSHQPLRRQHASTNRDATLRHEYHRLSQPRSTGGLAAGKKRNGIMRQSIAIDKENVDRSDRHESLIEGSGKGEDLDCIQGLLSLSQGTWQ